MLSEQFANDATTTLAATIAVGDTTLSVASNLGFPTAPQFRIRIDNEILLVTGVSGATWTVTRAAEPVCGLQLAAAHAAGAPVTHVLTRASIAGLVQVTDSVALSGGVLSLVNDAPTPGNYKYYGTNGSGTLGYFDVSGSFNPTLGNPISGATSGSIGNGLLYASNATPGLLEQTVGVNVTPANDGTGRFRIDNSTIIGPPNFQINFLCGTDFGMTLADSSVNYQLYLCDVFDGASLVAIDYNGNQAWLASGTYAVYTVGPCSINVSGTDNSFGPTGTTALVWSNASGSLTLSHNHWVSQNIDRWTFAAVPDPALGFSNSYFAFGYLYGVPGAYLTNMGVQFTDGAGTAIEASVYFASGSLVLQARTGQTVYIIANNLNNSDDISIQLNPGSIAPHGFSLSDSYNGFVMFQVYSTNMTLGDGMNLAFGTSTGTKIGTSTGQKIGFWNAAPAAQQVLATGASHTVDDVITFLQSLGLCRQS